MEVGGGSVGVPASPLLPDRSAGPRGLPGRISAQQTAATIPPRPAVPAVPPAKPSTARSASADSPRRLLPTEHVVLQPTGGQAAADDSLEDGIDLIPELKLPREPKLRAIIRPALDSAEP